MPHPAGNKPHSTVQVISHRATSGAAPENTLAAVEFALQQDADVVENDIQRTTDGALVIVHDTTLARTTGSYHCSMLRRRSRSYSESLRR